MKKFIDKILDLPKLVLRLWICLWICLIILLVMKFCFGIWYPIVIENQAILDFNDFVDSTFLKYIFLGLFYMISANILYLTSRTKRWYHNIPEAIILNIVMVGTFTIKCFNNIVGFICELLYAVCLPIFINLKFHPEYSKLKSILYPIIIQGIVMIWQLNILFVRNYPINLDEIGTMFQIVLQLDYYVFLSVLWIGVSYMELISLWFFCKDVTKLKAIKEQELAKANPNTKMIKEIDAKIAKLEETK